MPLDRKIRTGISTNNKTAVKIHRDTDSQYGRTENKPECDQVTERGTL